MIGKPEWFRRRKYTGWGFTPVTWQGWVYVFVSIIPIVLLASIKPMGQIQMIIIVIFVFLLCLDFIDIMIHLPKDERDMIHEAIAERNALWVIITVLAIGVAYQSAVSISKSVFELDPVILIAIFAGLLAKVISNIYLDKKN